MNAPLVSICIPTYNSGEFIKRTLDSVLNQTYKNIEVIIVDDCSKDNTKEIIEEYNDERIKLVLNEQNCGLSKNWNNTLKKASGKYIKLLCADDLIYENCIEEEVKALENNSDCSLVISNTHIVNSNDKITFRVKKLKKQGKYDGKTLAKKSILLKNYYGAPCSTLFRRGTANKIGLFDEELSLIPDFDLWLRLSYEGDVYFIDKYLSAFRVHRISNTNKLMNGRKHEYANEHVFMVKKHKGYNKIRITSMDIKVHTFMRNIRSFMLSIFVKHFNK